MADPQNDVVPAAEKAKANKEWTTLDGAFSAKLRGEEPFSKGALKVLSDIVHGVRGVEPLKRGDARRDAIRAVQTVLHWIGYEKIAGRIDGSFGPSMTRALQEFQSDSVSAFLREADLADVDYAKDGMICDRYTLLCLDELGKFAHYAKGETVTPKIPAELGSNVALGTDGWISVKDPSTETVPQVLLLRDYPLYEQYASMAVKRSGPPRLVVLHFDGLGPLSQISSLQDHYCFHFVIGRGGELIQVHSTHHLMQHVGQFKPPDGADRVNKAAGGKVTNVNAISLAVAFANAGYFNRYEDGANGGVFIRGEKKIPAKDVVMWNQYGRAAWEVYTPAALRTFVLLMRALRKAYPNLGSKQIFGHEALTEGMVDPGPAFPYEILPQCDSSEQASAIRGSLRERIVQVARAELALKVRDCCWFDEEDKFDSDNYESEEYCRLQNRPSSNGGRIREYFAVGAGWKGWDKKFAARKTKKIPPDPYPKKHEYLPPYCAAFVCYCWRMAYGAKLPLSWYYYRMEKVRDGKHYYRRYLGEVIDASCGSFIAKLKNRQLWLTPQQAFPEGGPPAIAPGDAVFFSKNGSPNHAALVVSVTSSGFRSIEGNQWSGPELFPEYPKRTTKQRRDGVVSKFYKANDPKIMGFGQPREIPRHATPPSAKYKLASPGPKAIP